jgi:hypothetical protein
MNPLAKRVLLLELARRIGRKAGGVVFYGPDETLDDIMRRASGPILLMPKPCAAEEWEESALAQQRRLMVDAKLYQRTGILPDGGPDPFH